ncbi:hypothetical protein Clacol_001820 [Clathrus columnatus]|uniref:Uncharacterized protein n=1 Tax=Clathrus columnatus TaxID=1419009 RepID=A0AAV5A3M1_9AGAM|nr:hypothetical protein Clacol_001820 [Clathrus columnatus]
MSFTAFLNPRTVEEPIQSIHGFPETSKLNESHNNRFHEKMPLDTENENVNREIEEFEESPNPSPVIERDEGSGSIPAPPPPSPSVIYHTFSIHILSLLMAFSVLGTLARLGLRALATYPNQSIFPLAWVQAVGCLVMGFALGIREPLTKFYGPLFTGITAGDYL